MKSILPIYPFQRREIKIDNKGTYNNLFEGGTYFELKSNEAHVKLSSDLPYWQIYNPAERTKIAV
jgi:hypothetical protein